MKKKNNRIKHRIAVAAILLILSAALMITAAKMPESAEWYSEHIYPFLVSVAGRLWGRFPFSVSEAGLYILLAAMFLSVVIMAVRIWRLRKRKDRGGNSGEDSQENSNSESVETLPEIVASWLSKVLLAVGMLAFLYTTCCGINYHRRSFSEEEGIETDRYTAEELKEVCLWLTDQVNTFADQVSRDDRGVMELDDREGRGAVEAMYGLAETFSALEGYYPQPKKVAVSEILSYQGLTGVYSPFTVEANYNGDMTAYNIPFTMCHELSHLRGFMQEEEANFIGFLACIRSERTDFQYSGYLSGWVYCMNALYRTDRDGWQEVRQLLAGAAEPDLAANSEFWDSYEGKISCTADKINDTYLKANGQADGVQSYSRMVDLIVAYFGQL